MIGPAPICMNCIHFNFERHDSNSCRAFPDSIPAAIIENRHDHRQPFRGDGGIRYEPIDPTYEPFIHFPQEPKPT